MPTRDTPEGFPHRSRSLANDGADKHRENAETIGLQALTFLLSDPTLMGRFLDETGLSPSQILTNAESPEVLEAALTVLANDEPLLLTFAAHAGLAPEDVVRAHSELATDGGRIQPLSMS